MYLEQTTLVCLHIALLAFFLICKDIFIIIDQCRFHCVRYGVSFRIQSQSGKIRTRKNSIFGHFSRSVFSWDRPWYSDECTRRLHYISYLDSLDLVSQKHRNGFQSGDLLKIPPTSLFMEEFGLYIQKKVSLKNMQRLNFPKITKSLKKYVSNATSSIRRLFTSV